MDLAILLAGPRVFLSLGSGVSLRLSPSREYVSREWSSGLFGA